MVIGLALAVAQFTELDRLASTVLASSAIAAAVIGFAARQVLANAIAGFVLAITQPLRIGDLVTFEDETGTVEDVSADLHVAAHRQRRADDHPERAPGRRASCATTRSARPRSRSRSRCGSAPTPTRRRAVRALEALPDSRVARIAEVTEQGVRVRRRGPGRGPVRAPGPRGRPARRRAAHAARGRHPTRGRDRLSAGASAADRPPRTIDPSRRPARAPVEGLYTRPSLRHVPPATTAAPRPREGRRASDPVPRSRGRSSPASRSAPSRSSAWIVSVATSGPSLDARKPINLGATSRVYAADGQRLGLHPGQRAAPADRHRGHPPEHQATPPSPSRTAASTSTRASTSRASSARRSRTSSPATRSRAARP